MWCVCVNVDNLGAEISNISFIEREQTNTLIPYPIIEVYGDVVYYNSEYKDTMVFGIRGWSEVKWLSEKTATNPGADEHAQNSISASYMKYIVTWDLIDPKKD